MIALLYSVGAHGIMTLNDFKAIEGDRVLGIRTIPVRLGPHRAALLACVVMATPQLAVIGLLVSWERPLHAIAITVLLLLQLLAMRHMLKDPAGRAPWYNGTGVTLYVLGMMAAAFAVSSLPALSVAAASVGP